MTKSTNSSPSKPRSAAAKQRLAESVSTSAGSASGGNATSTTEEVDILGSFPATLQDPSFSQSMAYEPSSANISACFDLADYNTWADVGEDGLA